MKCAYQDVLYNDTKSNMMTIYQSISIVALREVYGFGFGRFSRYCREIESDIGKTVAFYSENRWRGQAEGVLSSYSSACGTLADMGVRLDAIDERYAYEIFAPIVANKKAQKRIDDRLDFLRSCDKTMGVIWLSSMIWLHDTYGYGAVKLTRYYTRCRELMAGFSRVYLAFDNYGTIKYRDDLVRQADEAGVRIS